MRARVVRWLNRARPGYRRDVGVGRRLAPVPRPSVLDAYEGCWVAVRNGEVLAAEETSHSLALKLHGMDHRKRREVVVEYVRPASDAYIVGLG